MFLLVLRENLFICPLGHCLAPTMPLVLGYQRWQNSDVLHGESNNCADRTNDSVCEELIGKNILRKQKMKGPNTGEREVRKLGRSTVEVSLEFFES